MSGRSSQAGAPGLRVGVWCALVALGGCGGEGGQHNNVGPLPDLAPSSQSDLLDPGWQRVPAVIDHLDNRLTPDALNAIFGAEDSGSPGPCLVEPESGTWIPNNWSEPRFRFVPAPDENLFQITISAPFLPQDFVIYTSATTWKMEPTLWKPVFSNPLFQDQPVTVKVRGAQWDGTKRLAGPSSSNVATFIVSSVPADGSIYYWSTSGGQPQLRQVYIGVDKSPAGLRTTQASGACTGCHVASPEKGLMGFSQTMDLFSDTDSRLGIVALDQAKSPTWLSDVARSLLERPAQYAPSWSASHFSAGDRVMVSVMETERGSELAWTDLEATSPEKGGGWSILARDFDNRSAAMPFFSHDGSRVVYVAASRVTSGVIVTDGDVMRVLWQSRLGGTASTIAGAAEPAWNEFAPGLSWDDRLVAFARVPNGQSSFGNIQSDVLIVPIAGGTPAPLANGTPSCAPASSQGGLGNSWPRFAPGSKVVAGRRIYWMTFSSKRIDRQTAQIYIGAVIVDESQQPAKISTTPPLYVGNQPSGDSNHTPIWDSN